MKRILILLGSLANCAIAESWMPAPAPFRLSEVRLLVAGGDFEAPLWAPTSDAQLAFSAKKFEELWVADLRTARPRRVASGSSVGFRFAWSPDSTLLYCRERLADGTAQIKEVRVADAASRRIAKPGRDIGLPQPLAAGSVAFWSGSQVERLPAPFSGRLAKSASLRHFVAYQQHNTIYLDTETAARPISEPPGTYYLPLLSPDGNKVLYEEISRGLFVFDIPAGKTHSLGAGNNGRWSSDSTFVVFDIFKDDGHKITGSDLFVSDYTGSSKTQLTYTRNLHERHPSWSPDGRSIAFDAGGAIYVAACVQAAGP